MKTTSKEDRLTLAYALVKIHNDETDFFRNIEFNIKELKLYFDCTFHSIDTAKAIARATGLVINVLKYQDFDLRVYIF